jgi:hypothetical protein
MRIAVGEAKLASAKMKKRGPSAGGGGGGGSLLAMTIPKLVGSNYGNIREDNGNPVPLPGTIQDNDLLIAFVFHSGGNGNGIPTGSGWTQMINQHSGSILLRVWTKRWHAGDAMTEPFSNFDVGEGTRGIACYRNVDHIHADYSAGPAGNVTTYTPPVSWAAVPVGSRAIVFDADNSNNDWPLHIGAEGWRIDHDTRRWTSGGIIMSTADPAVWSQPCVLINPWSYAQMGGLMLVGPNNYGATWDEIVPTTRPTFLAGTDHGWNNQDCYVNDGWAAGFQEGDFWILGDGFNSYVGSYAGYGADIGDQGLWCLSYYAPGFGTSAKGRFISAAEAAAHSAYTRHSAHQSQSHGGYLIRGVNPHCPMRRIVDSGYVNDKTFADVTAGVKTILALVAGSEAHSQYQMVNWSGYVGNMRWNPQGILAHRNVAVDGEVISGLRIRGLEGETVASRLIELRGK